MIYVILPCYNEEKDLPILLKSIRAALKDTEYKIIAVDDASTDGTNAILNEAGCAVLKHHKNKGLGGAMKTLFSYINDNASDGDIAVSMDSDNSHPPEIICSMVDILNETGCDLVIASRYAEGGKVIGVPFYRKILSAGARYFLTALFPVKNVREYTSGYRAYRASIIKKSVEVYKDNFLVSAGFSCMMEYLIKLSFIGAAIREYPLVLRYDLKQGESKIKIFKTVRTYLKIVFYLLRQKSVFNNNSSV